MAATFWTKEWTVLIKYHNYTLIIKPIAYIISPASLQNMFTNVRKYRDQVVITTLS